MKRNKCISKSYPAKLTVSRTTPVGRNVCLYIISVIGITTICESLAWTVYTYGSHHWCHRFLVQYRLQAFIFTTDPLVHHVALFVLVRVRHADLDLLVQVPLA